MEHWNKGHYLYGEDVNDTSLAGQIPIGIGSTSMEVASHDSIDAKGGRDYLQGDSGRDTLLGGDGNDSPRRHWHRLPRRRHR